ncbi:MAG: hypothetical protein Q9201_000825 [Fulgogasparrea decipioides]
MEVVAEATRELQREQSARPLRIVREDPIHKADEDLEARFQQHAKDKLSIRRPNTKDWLIVVTWWLLKVRFHVFELASLGAVTPQANLCVSCGSKASTNQACDDLLKSSWILHTLLKEKNLSSLMTGENRKLFYNLSDGINEDLRKFKPLDTSGKQVLMSQNINT